MSILTETPAPVNTLDTGATYALVSPMLAALDAAEQALWPAGRVLCHGHGTHAAACLETAAQEDLGRYVVPVACGVCGGWYVEAEPARMSFEEACLLAMFEDDDALAPLPSGDGRWTLGRVR